MRRLVQVFTGILLIGILIPTIGMAQSKMITVEGMGNTKAQAIEQAKREAVASGIGMLLISETEIRTSTAPGG
jgi:hypothetical protein